MQIKELTSFISHFKNSAIFVVLTLLVGLEIVLRILTFGWTTICDWQKYDPISLQATSLVTSFPDSKLGWKLKPDLHSFYKGRSFTTNSHGFRDHERSVIPKSGIPRIAVLGRSYEMGVGVKNEDTWPNRLEKQYFQDQVEVLNFGVEAYSWGQVEANFHRFAKNFKSNCVALPVFYEEIDTLVPSAASKLPSLWEKYALASSWADHFYLPRLMQQSFWWLFFRHGSGDWAYLPQQEITKFQEKITVEPFSTVIQRLVATIQQEGATVIILPLPRLIRNSDLLYLKGRRLIEIYARTQKNVHIVKDLESLHDTVSIRDIAIPGDPHFNSEILDQIASITFKALKNEKICVPI